MVMSTCCLLSTPINRKLCAWEIRQAATHRLPTKVFPTFSKSRTSPLPSSTGDGGKTDQCKLLEALTVAESESDLHLARAALGISGACFIKPDGAPCSAVRFRAAAQGG